MRRLTKNMRFAVLAVANLLLLPLGSTQSPASLRAPTPPLGWNSWDGYGTTLTEDQFRENVNWFAAHLKPAGWRYVVIDMEWFVTNPTPEGNSKTFFYQLDTNGRYVPAENRFPSAAGGKGFKPLADYVHSLGLQFGIHILRGIPKKAVEFDSPIAGSNYFAKDAAVDFDNCPWNYDNFGTNPSNPASQAYYDSIASLYAGWGVDLIKVDCIASHPYRGDDIRMLSTALSKTGRDIVLSLSPGAAPIDKVDEMRKYANMWRISDDIWDIWHSDVAYPQGLADQFANAIKWAGLGFPGGWPDADMFPLGYLGPAPGWGQPRYTRLSHDEQRTFVTLWCIFRSPLMIGGQLSKADDWTLSLLTNPEVLAVDQQATNSHPALVTDSVVAWISESSSPGSKYLAVFNRSAGPLDLHYPWRPLGLSSSSYYVRDIWAQKDLGAAKSLDARLPAHGSVLYRLSQAPFSVPK